jgi:gliding motility-associated-like protein
MNCKKVWLCLMLLFVSKFTFATHNRAGELSYTQISALQYEFILTTFTDISDPNNADRPAAELNFGDGTTSTAARYEKTTAVTNIQRNRYRFVHTFPGYATYTISYQDPNRNNNVSNMVNSLQTAFYVECELVINPFVGFNNSPVLLYEPIDFGAENKLFVHNPNAYDADGDSLSFKLIPCKQDVGVEVFGFQLPNLQNGFTSNSFGIDPVTGQLVWDTPQIIDNQASALFNFAIMVEEWRYVSSLKKFLRMGYIVRDMQIEIVQSLNRPPVFDALHDTCIIAGEYLSKTIRAVDPDNNSIMLTATGGPFKLGPPDTVRFNQYTSANAVISQPFYWKTSCNSVRKQPYQILFKAIDNGIPKLVDLESWMITVVAPAPKNLTSQAIGSSVILNWEKQTCDKGNGYLIYRKSGSYPYTPNACETGIPSQGGYELIKKITNSNTQTFTDNNNGQGLSAGNNYCYRIVATFPDGAESIVSNETCEILTRDVPAIINVDISQTGLNDGKDTIKWVKPNQLDTIQHPGPYQYVLLKSIDNKNYTRIDSSSATYLGNLNDSVFLDTNINTLNIQHWYKVAIYANKELVGTSKNASSIFLTANPKDNRVELSFQYDVPWTNAQYIIYRYNPLLSKFEIIDTTESSFYIDDSLANGTNYQYFVSSIGRYTAGGFPEPLINRSQIVSATPVDTEKPCPPFLTVIPSCSGYQNELSWKIADSCLNDIVSYKIYKAFFEGEEFNLLADQIKPNSNTTFSDLNLKTSIAGCYFITAIDSANNESERSNIVCVDNCPNIAVPNAFTPNGDQINDLFTTLKDTTDFVSKFDTKIYDRWGTLVYETKDPEINWDGKDQKTGKELPAGVYFYSIYFSEIRVIGYQPKIYSGFVHLIR